VKDPKPDIDFNTYFVVVQVASGNNRPSLVASQDEAGNLKVIALGRKVGGSGFGYAIGQFKRDGIKKINGKALGKE